MRTITIEEHFSTPRFQEVMKNISGRGMAGQLMMKFQQQMVDLGAGRLADMDAAGIDMQVLSLPGIGLDKLDRADGNQLARESNDLLAEAVRAYPDRFSGFALLAMQDPESAAAELERCITKLGLKGAVISGTVNGRFLDDPSFGPVLAQAEKLEAPIYLHPAPPPVEVYKAYYGGLPEAIAGILSTGGWGWHAENGLHSLRLVVAGIFDRFPKLQMIIGHMGENIPFSLARADDCLSAAVSHLQRRVSDYYQTNFHITTSGYFTLPPFLCALTVFGTGRIIFAVDYPFSSNASGRAFLDMAPLSPEDLEKISHRNAERLLKLY